MSQGEIYLAWLLLWLSYIMVHAYIMQKISVEETIAMGPYGVVVVN